MLSKRLKTQTYLFFVLTLAFSLLSAFYYSETRDYAKLEAEKKIENYLLMHKAIHGYVEELQKPAIYKLKQEKKLYEEFFTPELMSFTFIARNVMGYYNKEREKHKFAPYYFKLASDNPRNEINNADAFELDLLKKMNAGTVKKYKTVLNENDRKLLYYAIPINANQLSCMRCHGSPEDAPKEMIDIYGSVNGFGESVGKIRAMISIKVDLIEELQDANKVFFFLSFVTMGTMAAIYFLVGYYLRKIEIKDLQIRIRNSELERFNKELEDIVSSETEKRLAQQQILIQQSKMAAMGEMTAAVAHQWKQPLNALNLIIQNMETDFVDQTLTAEDMHMMASHAQNQIEFMSNTIENFRHFFKPDKTKSDFEVYTAVKDVVTLLSEQFKRASLAIEFDVTTKNMTVHGNKNEFMQVVLNILTNAKDAIISNRAVKGEYEGLIKCSISSDSENLYLNFYDNGGGIKVEIIDSVFDAYFTTKAESKGTGIGLYMSKLIIEEGFMGKIEVKNVEDGVCFCINIPLKK